MGLGAVASLITLLSGFCHSLRTRDVIMANSELTAENTYSHFSHSRSCETEEE